MLTVDAILRRDFNELSKPIQGASPTQDICHHLEYGQVSRGAPTLSAHEKRARAIWTISRVDRVLNETESLYLAAYYGGHPEACATLVQLLANKTKHLNIDEISSVVDFLFTKIVYKKAVQLDHRFGWHPRQTYRKIATVRRLLAKINEQILPKLEMALQAELMNQC